MEITGKLSLFNADYLRIYTSFLRIPEILEESD